MRVCLRLSVRLLVEVHGNEEAAAAAAELELERRTIAAVNFRLDHQYCKHEVRANERFFSSNESCVLCTYRA